MENAHRLNRKYRVLDDCARLRDIIKSFPSGRYFVPSLLVITWSTEGETQQVSDFFQMVWIPSSILNPHVVLIRPLGEENGCRFNTDELRQLPHDCGDQGAGQ